MSRLHYVGEDVGPIPNWHQMFGEALAMAAKHGDFENIEFAIVMAMIQTIVALKSSGYYLGPTFPAQSQTGGSPPKG